MIQYDKLWQTLKARRLTKYDLVTHHGLSKAQLHRLQHNHPVNSNTLDRLCNLLQCSLDEIMEHLPDDNKF